MLVLGLGPNAKPRRCGEAGLWRERPFETGLDLARHRGLRPKVVEQF
jgi:hypothetical protein